MRAQSQEHVERCETATTPASQCRCRCNGRCHGRRLVADGAGRLAFESLPEGDPHRLQTVAEAARTRRERSREEKLMCGRRALIESVRRRSPEHAAILEARWFQGEASKDGPQGGEEMTGETLTPDSMHLTTDGRRIPMGQLEDSHLLAILPLVRHSARRHLYLAEAERRGLVSLKPVVSHESAYALAGTR